MSEDEKGERANSVDPIAPQTREIDGIVYPVRIIPSSGNQHTRIGVSRRPVKWSAGTEISSYDKKGRSKNPPKA